MINIIAILFICFILLVTKYQEKFYINEDEIILHRITSNYWGFFKKKFELKNENGYWEIREITNPNNIGDWKMYKEEQYHEISRSVYDDL